MTIESLREDFKGYSEIDIDRDYMMLTEMAIYTQVRVTALLGLALCELIERLPPAASGLGGKRLQPHTGDTP